MILILIEDLQSELCVMRFSRVVEFTDCLLKLFSCFSLSFNETTFSANTLGTVLPAADDKLQLQDFSPLSLASYKHRQKYHLC